METRAHYALIGAFTIAVVVAAFGFVFWFSGNEKPNSRQVYRIVFSSSVSGLSRGSQVLFNGLRVGEVTRIDLMQDDPSQVYALIDVDKRTPVKTDTRARLEQQGFTGVANVTLLGGGAGAAPLQASDGQAPTIYAERSDFQNIVENLTNLSQKADGILDKADKLLSENSSTVSGTLSNVQAFTKSLSDNSSGISDFLAGAADLGRTIRPLSQQLTQLSGDVDNLVKAVDPARIRSIVGSADQVVGAVARNQANIDQVLGNAAQASRDISAATGRVQGVLTTVDTALSNVGNLVKAVDPQSVATAVGSLSRFAETLDRNRDNTEQIIRNVGQVTAGFARDQGNIDSLLASSAQIARDLGQTSGKIGPLVDSVTATFSDTRKITAAFDSQKIASAIDGVSRFAETLDRNRDNTDQIIRNANDLTARLDQSAKKIDGVLDAAQGFLGNANQDGLFVSVTDAAKAIAKLATNLDARTREITEGINRFTGPGLRQYEALATDGRRTLDEINRTVKSLSKNPSQVIFGPKSSIPEYGGR